MSEVPLPTEETSDSQKPMWPAAAIILAVVFSPALVAWVLSILSR